MAQTRAVINLDINTGEAASHLRQLQAQLNAFTSSLNKNNAAQSYAAKSAQQQLLELVNTSRFFTAETVKMTTAAKKLDTTLSKGQATMGQFLGARFRKNTESAAQVMSLANARAAALETQFIATGAAANGMRTGLAIRPMQAFNKESAVAAERLVIQRAMLTQATTSMINFGKNTQWAGRQLMVGFTVPLGIFAMTAGKAFMDLEKQSIAFKKVYGDAFTTPAELDKNLQAVKGLSKEFTKYGIAAKDTMGLAAQAAATGAQNGELIDATTQATRLSVLGQLDQQKALETTIALQSAFGLSSKSLAKTVDFMNMVENQTVLTLQDLTEAIPRVGPVIKGLGGTVEDFAVMLTAMKEGGVSAAQGANALKSGLGALINPTKKAREQLMGMGVDINGIVQTNKGDLMGTIQSLGQALGTLDKFKRQQALESLFGKFQYARMGALFDNINRDGSQAARAMDAAAMSAENLAKVASKELGIIEESAATKFTAAMEKLKLAIAPIGEMFVKMATPIIGFLTSIADKFNDLPDFVKKFIGFGAVVTGVVIPAGTMFLGLLMNLVGTLVKFGNIVGLAFKGFAQGGIRGALANTSQALKYMSLAEIDAANAASQLSGTTQAVNAALRGQLGPAEAASVGIYELASAYGVLNAQMQEAATMQPTSFGVAGEAARGAKARPKGATASWVPRRLKRGFGGDVPGVGNGDTVPAMLTPGEFIINKDATAKNYGLLKAINDGQKLNLGGGVASQGRTYYGPPSGRAPVQNLLLREFEPKPPKSITRPTQSSLIMNQADDVWKSAKNLASMPETLISRINNSVDRVTRRDMGYAGPSQNIIKEYSYGVAAIDRNINNDLRSGNGSLVELLENHKRLGLDNPYAPLFETNFVKSSLSKNMKSSTVAKNDLSRHMEKLLEQEIELLAKAGKPLTIGDGRYSDITKEAFGKSKLDSLWSELRNEKGERRMGFETGSPLREMHPKGYQETMEKALQDMGLGYQTRTNKSRKTEYLIKDSDGTYYKLATSGTVSMPGKNKYQKIGLFKPGTVRAHFMNMGGMIPGYAGGGPVFGRAVKEFFTKWIASEPSQIAKIKGSVGREAGLTSILKKGFRKSKEAEVLQRATFLDALPQVGNTLNLGALSSFSPQGTSVVQHIADSKMYKEARAAAMFLKTDQRHQKESASRLYKFNNQDPQAKFSAEIYRDPRFGNGPEAYRASLESSIAGRKEAIKENKTKIREYNKLFPTIFEVSTPKGTIRANLDEIVALQNQKYVSGGKGGNVSEKERILHNAVVEILGVQKEGSITRVLAKLKSSEYPTVQKRNTGGPIFESGPNKKIVPGVGSTDTVPAMLTPGEFVINKQATKENLGLLHSINNGGVQKFAKGTQDPVNYAAVPTGRPQVGTGAVPAGVRSPMRGRGIASGVAGMAAWMPGQMLGEKLSGGNQMVGMGAGLATSMVATSLVSKLMGVGGAMGGGKLASMLGINVARTAILGAAGAIGATGLLVTGGLAAAAIGAYAIKKSSDAVVARGKDLADAMLGTSGSVEAMGKAFGRQTYAQKLQDKLATGAAERGSGVRVAAEQKSYAEQYVASEAGQTMVSQVKDVKDTMGSKDAARALANQLERGIMSGVLTPKEANAIAAEIGKSLGDTKIAYEASATIASLVDMDGKTVTKGERMKIYADLVAQTVDIKDAMKTAGLAWDGTGWIGQATMIITGNGTADIAAANVGESLMQAQQIMQEKLAENRLAFLEGNINQKQFLKTQKEILATAEKEGATWKGVKAAYEKAYPNEKDAVDSIAQPIIDSYLTALENANAGAFKKIKNGMNNVGLGKAFGMTNKEIGYTLPGTVDAADPQKLREKIDTAQTRLDAAKSNKIQNPEEIEAITNYLKKLEALQSGGMEIAIAINTGQIDPKAWSEFLTMMNTGGQTTAEINMKIGGLDAQKQTQLFSLINQFGGKGLASTMAISLAVNDPDGFQNFYDKAQELAKKGLDIGVLINITGKANLADIDNIARVFDRYQDMTVKEFKAVYETDYQGWSPEQKKAFDELSDVQQKWSIAIIATMTEKEYDAWAAKNKDKVAAAGGDIEKAFATDTLNNASTMAGPDGAVLGNPPKNVTGTTPSGGSAKAKTLAQEIAAQAKTARLTLEKMKALQGKGYKQFIAGPFAPEFLQYLADQGDRGLAILKGGLEKVKKVYADFNATRSNQMAQQAILGPKNRANEIKAMKDEAALRTRLRAKGMDSDQIDYVIEATKAYQDQINANKEQIKVTTNLAKKKALLADNKAIQKEVNLINTNSSAWYANAKAVENSKKSIEDLNTEYLSLNSQLMSSQRQLEEIQKIEPLQDKVSAEEKRIDSLNRSIELRQRESDVISRNIEMKQRELEPIDEQITKLEDLKTNTSELYDDQLKALDTIQKREEQIAQLKQDQLGIAQALSRGDVAGASQAALSMQQQVAQNSRDQSRTAIEAQRQAELDSVEAQITAQKDKRKEIEDKITQYQNDQRVIADAIYKIEQDRIPIQDTIYNLQTQINSETERMDEAYKNTTGRVIELQIEIAKLQKQMRDIGGQATAAGSSIVSDLSSNASQMTMDNGFVNGQYDAKFDKSLPGYGKNNGGSIRKMAFGNLVPGTGMMDRVPALLTPGEFVMRKSAVQAYGPMLAAMNSNVFPKMNLNGSSISTQNGNNASTVYNYDIAVNLNGTDLNADDVANVVMQKIRMGENTRIRSSNYRG